MKFAIFSFSKNALLFFMFQPLTVADALSLLEDRFCVNLVYTKIQLLEDRVFTRRRKKRLREKV
jgi:hypothetical protein